MGLFESPKQWRNKMIKVIPFPTVHIILFFSQLHHLHEDPPIKMKIVEFFGDSYFNFI